MIIGVMEADNSLIRLLKQQQGSFRHEVDFAHVPLYPREQADPKDRAQTGGADQPVFDAIIVHEEVGDPDRFCERLESMVSSRADVRWMAAVINNNEWVEERLLKHCASRHIEYVSHSGLSELASEVISRAEQWQNRSVQERSRLIVFTGSTPNVGTTIAAFATAHKLARETGLEIGYMCLNLKSSKIHRYLGIDNPRFTLDSIRAEIRSRGLSGERLRSYMEQVKGSPNLRVLCGNLAREQAEYYDPDDVTHLLDKALSVFDFTIADVNAYWDNAATLCTMQRAGSIIMVTTDQLAHFQEDIRRWAKALSPEFNLDMRRFDLFMIRQSNRGEQDRISLKHVRKETGMNPIGGMGYRSAIRNLVNEGRIAELLAEVPGADGELAGLVNTITALYRLKSDAGPIRRPEQSWYRRLLFTGSAPREG